MSDSIAYAFEDLSDDLPRPPMVAVRALLQAGLLPSPRGWSALPVETRIAIARHGLQGMIDVAAVRSLAEQIPPKYIKLISRSRDPDPDAAPADLLRALGPSRPMSDGEWRALRAVDRSVLASLTSNTRLLARAYDELAVSMGRPKAMHRALWSGAIAHCELCVNGVAIDRILSEEFLDGRALVLARVAGIRAARRVSDTLDLHAESGTGPVELDWTIYRDKELVLWQAHVSTWDGAFFPAAALLATTTAATALFDMIKDVAPAARIGDADIREEAWSVGDEGSRGEEATTVYSTGRQGGDSDAKPRFESIQDLLDRAAASGPRGKAARATPDPAARLDDKTLRDLSPPAEAVLSDPAPGSVPLIDPPPTSGPVSSQPVPPVSSAPVPSSHRARTIDGAPRSDRAMPPGLIALVVASLVILGLALSIFAYVILTSP